MTFPADLTGRHRDAMRDVVAIVEAVQHGRADDVRTLAGACDAVETLSAFAHLVISRSSATELLALRRLVDAMTAEEGRDRG